MKPRIFVGAKNSHPIFGIMANCKESKYSVLILLTVKLLVRTAFLVNNN